MAVGGGGPREVLVYQRGLHGGQQVRVQVVQAVLRPELGAVLTGRAQGARSPTPELTNIICNVLLVTMM